MGRLKPTETKAQKTRKQKNTATHTKPFTAKLRFTKMKQTLSEPGKDPVINENEVAMSRSKVLDAMRKTQPLTNEFLYSLTKRGYAERTLGNGTVERLELIEEIREFKVGEEGPKNV